MVLLLPFVLIFLGFVIYDTLPVNVLKKLESSTSYHDPKGQYQFPVLGEDWVIVAPDSKSYDDSDLELQGPLDEMNIVIYKYGLNENINSITDFRFVNLKESYSELKCTEKRVFAETQMIVISHTICHGTSFTDPAIITSTVFETEKSIYEMVGQMSSVEISFNKHEETIKSMVKGFKPL